LRGAYLGDADLSGADLSGADLSGANLKNAKLNGANLNDVNLSGTHLMDADLRGADLRDADLSGTYLMDADLRDADLRDAKLKGADLSGANLVGANLVGANLVGAYLEDVKGIGDKIGEIKFAAELLETITSGAGSLDMGEWHTCGSAHCIAGWAYPDESYPGRKASTKYPTLAKYFFVSEKDALAALRRVANGEESVFG
jgi:Pentapeptide repeats (8 copies)